MDSLKKKIEEEGIIIGNDILKVDSFINHQIDTKLLDEIGAYFASKFSDITKIITIEASGIAFGVVVAMHMGHIPVVFAKKGTSKILKDNTYSSQVDSFTKKITYNVFVDKKYVNSNDKCLIVDDFLAEGNACLGLVDICKQAGATVKGAAIVIEKGFQPGRNRLEKIGIRVESAAIIERFENGKVILK